MSALAATAAADVVPKGKPQSLPRPALYRGMRLGMRTTRRKYTLLVGRYMVLYAALSTRTTAYVPPLISAHTPVHCVAYMSARNIRVVCGPDTDFKS
jgi:hypothetical protein